MFKILDKENMLIQGEKHATKPLENSEQSVNGEDDP
jgi:hypothetical protein